jgi:hypothetical protein
MSNIGLRAAINTSKVNTGDKERIRTDRIQNPDQMTCPMWNGTDLAGRDVCANSFVTKMEGCHTAEDRLFYENDIRPSYTNYVTQSAAGISGDGLYRNNLPAVTSDRHTAKSKETFYKTPHFGGVSNIQIKDTNQTEDTLSANARGQDRDARTAQDSRIRQNVAIGASSQHRLNSSLTRQIYPNQNGQYTVRSSSQYARLSDYA